MSKEKKVKQELTHTEQLALEMCEEEIEKGLNSFIDVGNALTRIRDGRLYRLKYSTFEEYCQEKWGMTRRHANYQIISAETTKSLGTNVPKPANEAQARPLSRLKEPCHQRDAWRLANELADFHNRKVTAKDVEEAVCTIEKKHAEAKAADCNPNYKPRKKTISMDILGGQLEVSCSRAITNLSGMVEKLDFAKLTAGRQALKERLGQLKEVIDETIEKLED